MALCGLYPLIFPMRTLCFGPSRFFSQLHLPKRNKHQKDSNQAFENDQMGLKAAGMGSQPVLDHRCCAIQVLCSGPRQGALDPSAVLRIQVCAQDSGSVFRTQAGCSGAGHTSPTAVSLWDLGAFPLTGKNCKEFPVALLG